MNRGQSREIPPERKAVAVEGISDILIKPRHGCGRNLSVVFSAKIK